MATKTAVSLELVSTAPRFSSGQSVNVTAQLRNAGSGPVWLNKRMLLNTEHAPASMRELWLHITGPDGQAVPFSCKVRAGKAQAKDYALVEPGETVSVKLDLTQCFDLKTPGQYKVQASYKDGNPEVPASPSGAPHLAESLESQSVSIEVTPGD